MHIIQLRTFLAIAETGSFHRAALAVNITQPAVSARLKQLEDSLGVSLFERGRQGAVLTEAGRHLRAHAESMVRTWKIVSDDLARRFSGHLSLRLGAQLSIWDPLLLDLTIWVGDHLGKLPMTVNFDHQTNALDAIRNGLLDFTLTNQSPEGDIDGVRLPSEPLLLVSDRPATLAEQPLPLFVNCELGREFDEVIERSLPPETARYIFLGNYTMGLHYVRRRGGMIYVPTSVAQEGLRSGVLHLVDGAPPIDIPL